MYPHTSWRAHYLHQKAPLFEQTDVRQAASLYQTIEGIFSNSQLERLKQALRFYAQTLFIDQWDLIFVMCWQSLEALFSLEPFEVSHQLSERAACILHPPGQARKEAYEMLKNLYRVRSNIMHGRSVGRSEEKMNQNLKDLSNIARNILKKILKSRQLLDLYKEKDEKIREYFHKRLFIG